MPDDILYFNQFNAMNENSQYPDLLTDMVNKMSDELDSNKEPDPAKAATFLQLFDKWMMDNRANAEAFWNDPTTNAIIRLYVKPMALLKFISSNENSFGNMVRNGMFEIKAKIQDPEKSPAQA